MTVSIEKRTLVTIIRYRMAFAVTWLNLVERYIGSYVIVS
jgi:hypothetical protein